MVVIYLNIIFLSLQSFCLSWPDFYYYNRKHNSTATVIKTSNFSKSDFMVDKYTVVLIHGFTSSASKTNLKYIKDEYLEYRDLNIIIVDWENGAKSPDYVDAVSNAKTCGTKVGEFISSNIDPSTVHCIGHSLGAHACGFAGKNIKLNRISGIDPAGPMFDDASSSERLDKTDADFVDVMNTDDFFGLGKDIGHKNFYPNGGESQKACELFKRKRSVSSGLKTFLEFIENFDLSDSVICDHVIGQLYYAESINSKCLFKAPPCTSYNNLKKGKCKCTTDCSYMGHWANLSYDASDGDSFYLKTDKKSPYCLT